MKKQGPPQPIEKLNAAIKRKSIQEKAELKRPAKRRRSEEKLEATKLVKLDRATRAEKTIKPKKIKQQRAVNNDAQITKPLLFPEPEPDSGEEEIDDGVEEIALRDASLDEDILAEDMDSDEVSEASVFDSDQEDEPKGMFSEDNDSDAEAKLTAANIEGLSRKLDQEQADVEEDAQQELEDDALQTNIADDDGVLDETDGGPSLAPDLQQLRAHITETIRILGDFSKLAAKGKSRTEYMELYLSDVCTYYGYTPYLAEKLMSLFTPLEAFAFFEANESPRPVVLRTNTLRTNRRTLAQALINRGVVLEPVGKWSKVGLQVFESAVPLGATPEYLAGHYILQAASSFLPVMALAPQPNERVLDMAAAPGGKTTYISALMRNTGAVFANDSNRQRVKGLIGNIHRLGCKNTIVCNYDAQKAFPKILGGFDRVLLDAPCSGTGVIGKDPSVKTSKNERDFLALPHMQKQLLLAAIDSVDHTSKTGGYIVYSTCSVTVEENEGVVQYVLRKRPNVKVVDTGLGTFGSEGFKNYMNKKFDDKMNLTRRYFPHRENVDGFFVCKLKKIGPSPSAAGTNGDVVATKDLTIHGEKKNNGHAKEEEDEQEDVFGGFDDEEDATYIANAEKKWLKKRGLDPHTASSKTKSKDQASGNSKK